MIIDDIKRILNSQSEEDPTYIFYSGELNNINILNKIFSKASPEEKSTIIETLITYPILEYCLPFEFLIRKKLITEALLGFEENVIKSKKIFDSSSVSNYIGNCLTRLGVIFQDTNFSHQELEDIKSCLENIKIKDHYSFRIIEKRKEKILGKIILKHAELVKEKYSGEILSEDIEKVINLVREEGLDNKIATLIQKLKDFYYECDDEISSNIYATKVRDVMMEIIKNICSEISNGEKIQNKDENYRKYLSEKGLIEDYEEKFISSFYSFLSDLNNHSISTPKEYFRLSMIIVSEISLILLYNYNKYKKRK